MSDLLPRDLLIDILSRLPIKSLLKFRCVSKSWNSLILSSAFVTAHLNRDNPALFLVSYYGNGNLYSLHFDDKSFRNYLIFDTPNEMKIRYSCLVGSCNGVLCLLDDFNPRQNNLILWNPSIREMLKVPQPGFSHPTISSPYQVIFGFGFVSASNDYKVVRIMNIRECNPARKNLIRPVKVEVYSLNLRSWKSVDSSSLGLFHMRYIKFKQAFVNGIVHWLVYRTVNGKDKDFVLSFDLDDESFDEITLPKSLDSSNLSISVFQKSLVLFEYTRDCCHVWMMKEYGAEESWTKEFRIGPRDGMQQPAAFRKTGDILIKANSDLLSFNTQSQAICELGKFSLCTYADCYTESVVLLKELHDKRFDETASTKSKERLSDSERGIRLKDGSLVTGFKEEEGVNSPGVVEAGNEKAVVMDLDRVTSPRQEAQLCFRQIPIHGSKRKSVSIEQHTDLSEVDHACPVLYKEFSKSTATPYLMEQAVKKQTLCRINHPMPLSPSNRFPSTVCSDQVKEASEDEMFSLLAEFESEVSPPLVGPYAISFGSSDLDKANSSETDVQVAWSRVTKALSTGPAIFQNSQDVAALREALKLFFFLEPQGKISETRISAMRTLEQKVDQLESKFKNAEDALAEVSTLHVMKEQAGQNFHESFGHFKELKTKNDELKHEIMKLKAEVETKESIQKENLEKMTWYFTSGKSYRECAAKCEEELKLLSPSVERAKKDKADVESTLKHLQIDLA